MLSTYSRRKKEMELNIDEYDKNTAECIVGMLAYSIYYGCSDDDLLYRLDMMIELCNRLGRTDLVDKLNNSREDIRTNPYWFKEDIWTGPLMHPPVDNLDLYKRVRHIVMLIDNTPIEVYDLEAGYMSSNIVRCLSLSTKVKDNNATDDEVKEFTSLAALIHNYELLSKDKALELCETYA